MVDHVAVRTPNGPAVTITSPAREVIATDDPRHVVVREAQRQIIRTAAERVVVHAPGIQGPAGPSSGADGIVQQVVTAATNLSGHRVVTPLPDGTVTYADNLTAGHITAPLWVTTGAALAGAQVAVVTYGPLVEPSWAWTPGPLYLGANGALTQTPPVTPGALFLAQIGTATTGTAVFVDRYPSIVLT